MKDNYKLYKGDCIEVMNSLIQQGVKVDAVICDPPYGTTACKWDSVIPFGDMWNCLNQLIKPRGAVVLFGSEPFSSALRMSNIKQYKYDWIWNKRSGANVAVTKYQPLKTFENISVFNLHDYFPQMTKGKKRMKGGKAPGGEANGNMKALYYESDIYFPKAILDFKKERGFHPTQKPVALMEYLIKTYTNERGIVLDFTMGSGSTGVACMNTNRRFIGIERDDKYFSIATDRIKESELF